MNSQMRVQDESTCITKKKGNSCKLNGNGVADLVGTTLSTSFT